MNTEEKFTHIIGLIGGGARHSNLALASLREAEKPSAQSARFELLRSARVAALSLQMRFGEVAALIEKLAETVE